MPRRNIAIEIDDSRLVAVAPLERLSRGEIDITPIEDHQEHAVVCVYREDAHGHEPLTTFRLTHLTRFGRSRPVMRLSTAIRRRGVPFITVFVGSTRIARHTVDVSEYVGTRRVPVYFGVIALVAFVLVGAVYAISRLSSTGGEAAVRESAQPGIIGALAAGSRVVIEGHCAPAGSDEFLLALSRERAEAVARFLVDAGLPSPERIVGFGAERLIASDVNRMHLNRRVEIVLESSTKR